MSSSAFLTEADDAVPHPLAALGVVLVGAGSGRRLGAAQPKAFTELHGRPLIEFGVGVVTSLPHAGHLVVVVPESHAARALELVEQVLPERTRWEVSVVAGGRERYESVRFGLDALPESIDTVLVHDAARPFASAALFERVIAEVRATGDGVVPALRVTDTLKRVDADGLVHETVDRDALVGVQTPQGFPRELLAAAYADAELQSAAPTDDADVVQRGGGRVRTVPGEMRAHKLTTPDDIAILEHFLAANAAGLEPEQ
ncbi:2-C-methyl-D-erythritol 4-phosphate cytidylyltransferase [Leucobacter chromiiresistens]|uniref:2-C-methyl-D-erythritol 4-phosphate cytidylyltransferase n=1 Tax=Leucobacter chromiiresistens TaxID=1079994 RepID=A0A1H0YW62_9MICO|nr:2-C-methyl-D-erythritol 4-phosphate cytidylyltransferase [Leucobacter chromiiresistens]SDQ19403.1 2-C-methyl-D-erythritol 4-phosphate cytidylyltransferase [Leucobacter chromiiresistens]